MLNLRWDEIGALSDDGANVRIDDTKTGPRAIWLGPEAARMIAALPRAERTSGGPEDLTSGRLHYLMRCPGGYSNSRPPHP